MGLDTIKGLKKKLEAVQKEMATVGETAITEAFQEIFTKWPTLKAVKWEQYTPYFNDGDACEFSVHEFHVSVEGINEEEGDYGDGFIESFSDYSDDMKKEYSWRNPRKTDHPLEKMFEDLGEIQEAQDMLLAVFGDHQEIIVYRDGTIEKNESSHD